MIGSYEKLIYRRDLAHKICRNISARYFRCQNVIFMSGSSLFSKRWDDYINNGVALWNEDKIIMSSGIKTYFGKLYSEFEELNKEFIKMNGILGKLRLRQRGRKRSEMEDKAKETLETLTEKVTDFEKKILEAIYQH